MQNLVRMSLLRKKCWLMLLAFKRMLAAIKSSTALAVLMLLHVTLFKEKSATKVAMQLSGMPVCQVGKMLYCTRTSKTAFILATT